MSRKRRSNKRSVKRRSVKRKSNTRKSSVKRGGCNSGGKKLKLLSIKKSPKKEKKLVATFCKNNRIKRTHFGARGMSDFTKHRTPERKNRYISRHSRGGENWNNPTSAGALSRWVLWNKPSLRASIADYKRRFKL